ncbi:MAG: hypothetical protein IKX84_09325, partial [Clostridia bacterium]|nr:hypothetical protein [Clostridia bacterium]
LPARGAIFAPGAQQSGDDQSKESQLCGFCARKLHRVLAKTENLSRKPEIIRRFESKSLKRLQKPNRRK